MPKKRAFAKMASNEGVSPDSVLKNGVVSGEDSNQSTNSSDTIISNCTKSPLCDTNYSLDASNNHSNSSAQATQDEYRNVSGQTPPNGPVSVPHQNLGPTPHPETHPGYHPPPHYAGYHSAGTAPVYVNEMVRQPYGHMAPAGQPVPHVRPNPGPRGGSVAGNSYAVNSGGGPMAGQQMGQRGVTHASGQTPTLNQLLQTPNPLTKYQNNYAEASYPHSQHSGKPSDPSQQPWNSMRPNSGPSPAYPGPPGTQASAGQQAMYRQRFGQGFGPGMPPPRMAGHPPMYPTPGQAGYAGYNHHQGYGPNYSMMPPPSGYPSGKPAMNVSAPTSPVGAQAAAQAALVAAANSATMRPPHPSPVYAKQHMSKMYPSGQMPTHVNAGNAMMGPPAMQHPRQGDPSMPPPATTPIETSLQPAPMPVVLQGAPQTSSESSSGNSSVATTSVTQSITSPLPTPTTTMDTKSGQSGPQPPPILDEASQASTSSSQPEEAMDVPQGKQNSKGHPTISHPPTPNTLGSPGAASMSSFHDDFESVSSPSWPRTPASPVINSQGYDHSHSSKVNKRPDGLLKLYDMSDDPERKVFLDKLIAFNEERGVTLSSCPTISKQPLDLFKLYVLVKERGGFSDVTRQKLWKECAQICNIANSSSAAYTLRKQYIKHLLPFECKFDRGGIDHQLLISQTENSNRKKNKGAPSPGPGDSNSQGSYPLSGTPGQVEGPYPQHLAPQPNSYPPTMQPFPPPPGMTAPDYPPNVHQGSYPHPPANAGPPQHHSAQIPVASNHTPSGGESISAQDPFSDEMQPTSNYNHQRHPSGPPPSQVSQPPPMSVPSQGPPVSTHTNSYNYNTPNYPSSAPGSGSYYPPQSITPGMHHEQFSSEQNTNQSEYASRQQSQMPPTVPPTPEVYSSSQPQSARSYSPNRSVPPVAQSSTGQPYYNHQGYDYNRDNRGYDQRHSAPGQTQPPPPAQQQPSVPPPQQQQQQQQQPPVPAASTGPTQAPPTSSHHTNYNTYNNPSFASNTQPSGKHYNSGPQHHEQFTGETPAPAPEYANRTQSTPTPGQQQQSMSESFTSSAGSSGGYVANRALQPSGQNYYGQQCYDYQRDNRTYERSADNIYGQQTPQQSVTQRGQMYPSSTQPSQHPTNAMGYPPRGTVQQPYSSVGQQSDAYRNSEMSGYQNSMIRTHSTLAQRLLAAKLAKPSQDQTGVYQNTPSNMYPPTPATAGNKLGPPSQPPTTPPPNAIRDSAMYGQGTGGYPVPKRHPDFMKQEQQSYPMSNYQQGPAPSQYQHYATANRHSPVTSGGSNPPNQMWNREAPYRYGPPSGAPASQYGPPPRETWDPMNARPDGNWAAINRYNAVQPQPSQGFGSNSDYYVNSYTQSGGHPMNKMSYVPRPNDPNRMYAPSQIPGNNMAANKPSHIPHLHMNSNSSPSPGPTGYPNAPPTSSLPHHHLSFQASVKKEIIFPSDSIEATQPTLIKRRKLTSKDITQVEAWRLLMCLKSGLLAESTWALDVLSILVHDDNTVLYFGLQHLPGLLEVLLEHYKKYLSECFEGIFSDNELGAENEKSSEIKSEKKWYEIDRDLKENCDSSVDANSDDELTFTSKTNKLLVNIPKVDEQLVLLNSVNYTYRTRDGKPVRVKNSKNLFVIDYDKKWDLQSDTLFSATDHWENGVGQFLSHIQTHFESNEKFLRFAKVLKDKSVQNKEDVESDSSSNDNNKLKINSVHISCKKEAVVQSPSNVPLDSEWSDSSDVITCADNEDGRDEVTGKRKCFDDLEEEAYSRDDPPLCAIDDYCDALSRRCLCLSTLIRNLSFVPGNDVEMSKHCGLLLILGRLILFNHRHSLKKRHFEKLNGDELLNAGDEKIDDNNNAPLDREWWWETLHLIRENTLVTIANISGQLDLSPFQEKISLPILDGLLHWAVCPSSYAQDNLPTTSLSTLSPQRLSLEALVKLSTLESNVDLIIATPPWYRLDRLYKLLSKLLNRNEDQTLREFSLVLLVNFAAADTSIARAIALTGNAIPQLISFVEQSEQSALSVANSQGINALRENPELMGTTLDMVRRAAACLRCLSRIPDNRPLFLNFQQRLLALVMSQILDQGVASIIADVIYECSLFESDIAAAAAAKAAAAAADMDCDVSDRHEKSTKCVSAEENDSKPPSSEETSEESNENNAMSENSEKCETSETNTVNSEPKSSSS